MPNDRTVLRENPRMRLPVLLVTAVSLLTACGGGSTGAGSGGVPGGGLPGGGGGGSPPVSFALIVSKTGTGSGAVTSSPVGIDCGADCGESYAEGTSVTLTAMADAGSVFSGWSGDCAGDASSAAVLMSADRGCTAQFDALPAAPTLSLAFDIKQLQFSWTAVDGATHYRLLENPDGASGFTVIADPLTVTEYALDIAVHRHDWAHARYLLQACNDTGCTDSNQVDTLDQMLLAVGYFKASNTGAGDNYGIDIALSADGSTLAVGAVNEDSGATGVDGAQTDETAADAGAVYVYTRVGGTWSQQAYVKASNTQAGDRFGYRVALSADGNTLAVGADAEDSAATGIGGDQADNTAPEAGAVYVFTRGGETWSQQAYVKASNAGVNDRFGQSLALDGNGDTLVVGAPFESSDATGIDGDQTNNAAGSSGAAYVFTRSGGVWAQQAYVKASNTTGGDLFGLSVALASDGDTLAVGALWEDSAAPGIGGDQTDETAVDAGAAYVFARTGGVWAQQAYVKASNPDANDRFGESVALAADGNTLAVGATNEDSNATGVDGDPADNTADNAGAVYVYTRTGASWSQQAYVKAPDTQAFASVGQSVALSGDGNTLAMGAPGSAKVYVMTRTGDTWAEPVGLTASNPGINERYGWSLALTGDGNTLAVGAQWENGGATGVSGDLADKTADDAGAVYLY